MSRTCDPRLPKKGLRSASMWARIEKGLKKTRSIYTRLGSKERKIETPFSKNYKTN